MFHEIDTTIRLVMETSPLFYSDFTHIDFSIPGSNAHNYSRLLNCYLFDIHKKNHLDFDLTYLITAWAVSSDVEHRLLSETFKVLQAFPILNNIAHANGLLTNCHSPICGIIISQPRRGAPTIADVWRTLEQPLKPSLLYRVGLATKRSSPKKSRPRQRIF